MDIVIILMCAFIIALLAVIIVRSGGAKNNDTAELKRLLEASRTENAASDRQLREEVSANVQLSVKNLGELLSAGQRDSGSSMTEQLKVLENRFKSLEAANEQKLEQMRVTMTRHLTGIQEENSRKLEAIQTAVNEKLESKMNESFRLVSERLEQVYKGLGEMQTIATGVGDLKKVLSNVKNRGILGEIQLGSILEDILIPEQYDRETATVPGSTNRVEFAVKLPGSENGSYIYLPIDSKFPGDTYAALQDAYETGDPVTVADAKKQLISAVKKSAKDIRDKYVQPPYTTNFGIMFLPFEGLYSEVVNSGVTETLQREFNVSVAGPSTMAAMLNSLQMGFRTLAIQKKSNQVWEILGAVKSEFLTFSKVLEETQKHIKKVDDDLEKLVGVRTRQINRKLSAVEAAGVPDELPDDEL
ncbi:MAG: DNA recombination protein RmuC [Ruminococcus sp.]|nr:DNA recombination protein RmuC [Ruminococcus sp.]